MQLSTEWHVSTPQGLRRAYKMMLLVKVHAAVLPAEYRGLQFIIYENIKCDKIGINDILYQFYHILYFIF